MRKTVLQLTSMALATLLASGIMLATDKTAPVRAAEKPNFVFVMTDDMPEKLMAKMSVVRDRVAARGATFRNAYVTQSLCCPSRASFLRGQYPHNHGITGNTHKEGGNEIEFRSRGLDEETVAVWLDRAGYKTGLVGKYMNGYNDTYVPPGWDTWRVQVKARESKTYTLSENGTLHDYPFSQWDVSTDLYRSKARLFLDKATDQAADQAADPRSCCGSPPTHRTWWHHTRIDTPTSSPTRPYRGRSPSTRRTSRTSPAGCETFPASIRRRRAA
jgi:arylsulfatase A-like enzyme